MEQYILAPQTTLRQPLCTSNGIGNEKDVVPPLPKQHHTLQMEQGCPVLAGVDLGWVPRCPHDDTRVTGAGG